MSLRTPSPVLLLGLAVISLVSQSRYASAQEGCCPRSLEHFSRLSWSELEEIYQQAHAGAWPNGRATGRVIYPPDKKFPMLSNGLTRLWWKGKHFCADRGELVNQWLIGKAIRGRMQYGPSRIDGKAAIILDYSNSWSRWRDVRDEMREVAPGLYLGAMFYHSRPCDPPALYFLIQLECNEQ